MWVCGAQQRYGDHNLAVFYGSCTMNCLFCQNWHYRDMLPTEAEISQTDRFEESKDSVSLPQRTISARELANAATRQTYCVCFFGGDPASQMPHALASAAYLAKRDVTICWETSGTANSRLMDRAVEYSMQTGGTVKFDLKAYDDDLHYALTGVSNQQTLENFTRAATHFAERPDIPLVVASTLLVPGYVDAEEVARIAHFIAGINPDIPYSLLGFGPHFYMPDLPATSVNHAAEALEAACGAGLQNVHIGNRHLLSHAY
jgi:pyruvate formate lyase activating enzyme